MKTRSLGLFICNVFSIAFLMFLFGFWNAGQVDAAAITWEGDDSALWSTDSNWAGGVAPGTGDVATFDGTGNTPCTIDAAIDVAGIDINSGYTETITQGAAITLGASGYDQAAGTFVTGAYNMEIVGGTWNHSAGTWTASVGTVIFSGAGTIYPDNDGTNDTETFYNLTLNKTNAADRFFFNNTDIFVINGTLTLTKGDPQINSGTGYFSAKGDVTIGANLNATNEIPLYFTGTGDQSLDATGGESAFDGPVVVNKSSGTLYFNSDLTLDASGQDFTLTNGSVDIQANTLTVADDFTQSEGAFDASAGSLDLHDFTLDNANAVFQAPTETMTVSGYWTRSAGTFNHNGGEVEFDNSVASYFDNDGTNDTETFGNLTLNNTADIICNNTDNIVVTADLTLTQGKIRRNGGTASITVQGDVDIATGFDGTSDLTLAFTGSANQTVTAAPGAEGNWNTDVTINKSTLKSVTLGSTWTLDATGQDLTVVEGGINLNGNNLTVNNTFTIKDGGTFRWFGTETTTAPTLDSGSTVRYSATSGNTVIQDWSYHHIRFSSNTDDYRLGAAESIAGDLTIDKDVEFDLRGYDLTVTGTMNNDGGTLKVYGSETFTGTLDTDSGKVEFKGDGDSGVDVYTLTDFATAYNTLEINSRDGANDQFVLGAPVDVNNSFNTVAGTFDFSPTNHQLTIGGSWTHVDGSITVRGATVVFDDVSKTSTISGGPSMYNLTCTTASKALQFEAGETVTVSGTMTLTGTSGNEITLNSTSEGTAWLLNAANSSVDYVDVQDSNASSGSTIVHATSYVNSIDSGNNTNWGFPSAAGGSSYVAPTPDPTVSSSDSTDAVSEASEDAGDCETGLNPGGTLTLSWSSTSNVQLVNLYYSIDEGTTYTQIAGPISNIGYYSWTIPEDITGPTLQFKVEGTDLAEITSTYETDSCVLNSADQESEEDTEETTDETDDSEVTEPSTGERGVSPVTGELEDISVVGAGDYIRSSNFSTVYYIQEQDDDTTGEVVLVRRPFMDAQTYFTYQDDFEGVKTVTDATLTTITLGQPMLPNPGVVLIKIQSDNKVYAIDTDGYTIRWIQTEEIANTLYGADWADYIIDIEATFFPRFTRGDDVEDTSGIQLPDTEMKRRSELSE